jgi:Flp pilus assembly protein TadG
MLKRLQHIRHDERGISTIYVGVGFMAFMAVSTLAIDVGMFMTARTQAQNSADAGALAGAIALVYNNYNDRTSSGPAVQNALAASRANQVMSAQVDVQPADVTFPNDPTGLNDRVRVYVYRTTARGNPVPTMIGPIFGVTTVDIIAMATAEASPATSVTCVKPFTIPDKWVENQDPGGWTPNSTFDMYDDKGRPLANPDVYNGDLTSPNYSGFNSERDKGLQLMIRAGTGNEIAPSTYYSWAMPGGTGGSFYRDNIDGCNQTYIAPGSHPIITQEPGNMVGPTNQGVDDLIAQDANAYWDDSCNCVKGSAFKISPRVFPIPVFDPVYFTDGKQNGRNASLKVANVIGFFVTSRNGNNVYGRITPITGIVDRAAGPAPQGSFARAIRLVE